MLLNKNTFKNAIELAKTIHWAPNFGLAKTLIELLSLTKVQNFLNWVELQILACLEVKRMNLNSQVMQPWFLGHLSLKSQIEI